MDDRSQSFQVLGLKPGASADEVKQSYRDLVKVWHPDRFAHDERLRLVAQNKLKEINGAYKLLQAHFFDASIAPEPSAKSETESAAENPASAAPPLGRRRAGRWATLGMLGLIVVAAVLFFKSGRDHVKSSPGEEKIISAANSIAASANHYALSFDGRGSRVEIATTGSLTGTFTVECWALSRRPKVGGTIISSRGPNDCSFDLKFRQARRFHADIGDGARWLVKDANTPFSYNRDLWYHIAYVVTPVSYTAYVNGERWETGAIYPAGTPLLYAAGHQLCLGADKMEPMDLDGGVAELRIWRTARTAEQIRANMNLILSGDEPGLQGCWRFAEGEGTRSADSSGHGFTARLVGKVSWTTNVPPIARSTSGSNQ